MARLKWLCLLLIPAILLSCASGPPSEERMVHYVLEYPPPLLEGMNPLDADLRVERFEIASIYNSLPIVYRENPFERKSYVYHAWLESPADMLGDFFARDLRASDIIRVMPRSSDLGEPRFLLMGDIEEFYELDEESAWYAVLTVAVMLVDDFTQDASKRVILNKTYHEKRPCKGKGPKAVAEAMSRAAEAFSKSLIRDVYSAVESRLTEGGAGPKTEKGMEIS